MPLDAQPAPRVLVRASRPPSKAAHPPPAWTTCRRPFHGWMLRKAFGVAISRVPPSAVVWDSLVPGCATEDQSLKAPLPTPRP